MALSAPTLLEWQGTGGSDLTTESFTPTAGSLVIVIGTARSASGIAPGAIGITDSLGTVFSALAENFSQNGTTAPSMRMAVFAAVIGPSPSARTITLTSTSHSHLGCTVVQVLGAGIDLANIATGTDTTGDPSVTLGTAPAASSLVLGAMTITGTTAPTVSPLANALTANSTTNHYTEVRYTLTGGPTSGAWTSAANRSVAMLLEIKEDAAALVGEVAETVGIETTFGRQIAATRALAETVGIDLTFGASLSSNSSPERPSQVWLGATRTWNIVTGVDPIAGNNMVFS